MRRQIHWLAVGFTLLAAAASVSVMLLWPSEGLASSADTGDCAAVVGDYCSPQCCGRCHDARLRAWSGTSHAIASVDPLFRVSLQQEEEPGDCLGCHSTGYDAASGRYALAGVTCEACHGTYQPGHSSANMEIARPEKLCGTCHTSTFSDWDMGLHGEGGEGCIDCHNTHARG